MYVHVCARMASCRTTLVLLNIYMVMVNCFHKRLLQQVGPFFSNEKIYIHYRQGEVSQMRKEKRSLDASHLDGCGPPKGEKQ